MKNIFTICLLLFFSCNNGETGEINQLSERVLRLEQRMDSLTRNGNRIGSNNRHDPEPASYGTFREGGRCQAITKKGTQCKRKAKNNSHCWQHGG